MLGINELYVKTGKGQTRRFIPIHDVAHQLGHDKSLIMSSIHALSGCDSTSSLGSIGKSKWETAMNMYPELWGVLSKLGQDPSDICPETIKACTTLTCSVYGIDSAAMALNDARYELFSKRKLSSEKLPPTDDAFEKHIQRVNYQCFIWNNATRPILNLPSPIGRGWVYDVE